jgi:hypothetical protein
MELHDICDGCGRHPGVCMCSIVIGTEGSEAWRPNPVTLADKLRMIAADTHRKDRASSELSTIEQIKYTALAFAKQGHLNMSVHFAAYDLNKEQAEPIADELRRNGFHVTIATTDDMMVVSWV